MIDITKYVMPEREPLTFEGEIVYIVESLFEEHWNGCNIKLEYPMACAYCDLYAYRINPSVRES